MPYILPLSSQRYCCPHSILTKICLIMVYKKYNIAYNVRVLVIFNAIFYNYRRIFIFLVRWGPPPCRWGP